MAPELKEKFGFADIRKSLQRYICSIDWHPLYSGLLICSYTFSTIATSTENDDKTDIIKRTILSPNPVIMWCFDNTLDSKLELETPREITYLSFCPYDENLILGGTINGQLLIWDIKNCLENIETEEILTESQIQYRTAMRSFLQWTKQYNKDKLIQPAAQSALQHSHKGSITNIQWLDRKHYVTILGSIGDDNPEDKNFRFFVTTSMDGTIAFWDLDAQQISELKRIDQSSTRKLPEHMKKKVSDYDKLNRILRPVYLLVYNYPITSMIFDCGIFRYEPIINLNTNQKRKLFTRVSHKLCEMPQEEVRNRFIITSYFGNLLNLTWDGIQANQSGDINKETINQVEYIFLTYNLYSLIYM